MLLKKLTEANGGPGNEKEVRDLLRQEITPLVDEVKTDAMGNLLGLRNQSARGPRVMLAAHMDEVCLMVMGIEKNGMLKFAPVGGIDPRVLVAKSVVVGPKKVRGVIGAKPIHLQKPAERKQSFSLQELFIDLGCSKQEEAEGLVSLGDYAYFTTQFEEIGEDRLKGKAFDDRAGCALIVELLKEDCPLPLAAAFTVQEEVGLRGAGTAAFGLDPDLAIVLESTTASDTPGSPDHKHATTVGAGPCLTFMDRSAIPNPSLVQKLKEAADTAGIPFQMRRTTTGGTDAGAISLTKAGIPTAVLALPCRYIHSPVSVLSRNDYEGALGIMRQFLKQLVESEGLQ